MYTLFGYDQSYDDLHTEHNGKNSSDIIYTSGTSLNRTPHVARYKISQKHTVFG